MARRKRTRWIMPVAFIAASFGVWWYVTQPRRDWNAKIDRAVEVYKAKKEQVRQDAKAELQDILDKTLGK